MGRRGLMLVRLLLATALTVTFSLASPLAARACACGAVVGAQIGGETALVYHDGSRERIDMVLSLTDAVSDAAWIMPTPRDTTISLGDTAIFAHLISDVAPRQDDRASFRLALPAMGAGGGAPLDRAAVNVDAITTVGPFTVTTLSGSDPGAVNAWLTEQGYPTRPGIVSVLKTYLDQDWRIQAVKLVPGAGHDELSSDLPPLRMSFATDAPVYPIKLSAQAGQYQQVTLYVAGLRPLVIEDHAAPDQPMELIFSGAIPADHVGAVGDDVWLTAYAGMLNPAEITHDITMRPSDQSQPYQRVAYTGPEYGATLMTAALVVVALGLGLSVLAAVVVGVVLAIRAITRPVP